MPQTVTSTIGSSAYLDGPDGFAGWVAEATAQTARDLGEPSTPTVLLDGVHLDPARYDWSHAGHLEQAISDARR